jgi:hypothetical protein
MQIDEKIDKYLNEESGSFIKSYTHPSKDGMKILTSAMQYIAKNYSVNFSPINGLDDDDGSLSVTFSSPDIVQKYKWLTIQWLEIKRTKNEIIWGLELEDKTIKNTKDIDKIMKSLKVDKR